MHGALLHTLLRHQQSMHLNSHSEDVHKDAFLMCFLILCISRVQLAALLLLLPLLLDNGALRIRGLDKGVQYQLLTPIQGPGAFSSLIPSMFILRIKNNDLQPACTFPQPPT
eukprot:1150654-Pelagomonas_calceolata.AAC.6